MGRQREKLIGHQDVDAAIHSATLPARERVMSRQMLHAIASLSIHGVLTTAERDRARARLMKRVNEWSGGE